MGGRRLLCWPKNMIGPAKVISPVACPLPKLPKVHEELLQIYSMWLRYCVSFPSCLLSSATMFGLIFAQVALIVRFLLLPCCIDSARARPRVLSSNKPISQLNSVRSKT